MYKTIKFARVSLPVGKTLSYRDGYLVYADRSFETAQLGAGAIAEGYRPRSGLRARACRIVNWAHFCAQCNNQFSADALVWREVLSTDNGIRWWEIAPAAFAGGEPIHPHTIAPRMVSDESGCALDRVSVARDARRFNLANKVEAGSYT